MPLNGFVCYCPDLRLYWYKVSNPDAPDQDADYKFNDDELENAIATHLASDQTDQATFMAELTGIARVSPHKIVRFDQEKDEIKVVSSVEFWREHDTAEGR